jgi:hypothetical protein
MQTAEQLLDQFKISYVVIYPDNSFLADKQFNFTIAVKSDNLIVLQLYDTDKETFDVSDDFIGITWSDAISKFDLKNIVNLTQLFFSDVDQLALPEGFWKLNSLARLIVVSDRLSILPGEIGQLTSLTSLILRTPNLTSLPSEIVRLSALTHLDLAFNNLTSLPAEIVQLSALTFLNLSGNYFTSLPAEIAQLSALTSLNLSGTSSLSGE